MYKQAVEKDFAQNLRVDRARGHNAYDDVCQKLIGKYIFHYYLYFVFTYVQATIDRIAAESAPAHVRVQITRTKVDRERELKRLSANITVIFLLSYINLFIYSIYLA